MSHVISHVVEAVSLVFPLMIPRVAGASCQGGSRPLNNKAHLDIILHCLAW